ncbi:MAG: UDP-N-acetylmuramate dehydrogenase [Fluviicola sp.]|jgi:UDP-N-acetylmuramate dehydrogenase
MIQQNISLKEFNTFGIDVKAKAFARFSSIDELKSILNENEILPLFILGGGSNILFTKDVDALVLKNEIAGLEIIDETSETVTLKVGAGVVWHDFVLYTIEKGWSGVENMSLIPGNVGASPMQNIGAYGVEIKDVFSYLEAFNLETQKIETIDAATCKFGYRESIFKREAKGKYVISAVFFQLNKTPDFKTSYGAIQTELEKNNTPLSIRAISDAVISIRQSKLPNPKELGNAGSFFKNPVISTEDFNVLVSKFPAIPNYPQDNGGVKLAAGWLIEQAGWKGKRIGNVGMHEKQALVLVNYGDASGEELLAHSQKVIDSVKELFNVELEREVNIW